ncbi:hypothetical protein ANO11243_033800 [Dothideomycetidae sp. 11243]|nr:hypothetical protein ANO11243_033800 [fungal sp. No.11243]
MTHPSSVTSSPWMQYSKPYVSGELPHRYTTMPPAMRSVPGRLDDESSSVTGDRLTRSPSAFGSTTSSTDNKAWIGPPLGMGMHPHGHDQSSITSMPRSMGEGDFFGSPSPSLLDQPRTRRILPNGLVSSPKRSHDDEDRDSVSSFEKRRKLTTMVPADDLADEDRLLAQLKEEEDLPWKAIAARFTAQYGRKFQVAALQMRYKRLREKHRTWTTDEIDALKLAHEHWEKAKWEIISSKMVDLGVPERWPAKLCAKKWQLLFEPGTSSMQHHHHPEHIVGPGLPPFSLPRMPSETPSQAPSGEYLSMP